MANGNFGGGSGATILDPLLIEDLLDLNAVRNGLAKYYKLVNDIDASYEALVAVGLGDSGKGFKPIGWLTDATRTVFTGYVDFNYKKIYNLYINRPTCQYCGLFSTISSTIYDKIKKARIENAYVYGSNYTGILTGQLTVPMSNIYVSGTVIGGDRTGGITGDLATTGGLSDCRVQLSTLKGLTWVGGAVGSVAITSGVTGGISKTVVTGNKISAVAKAGGVYGFNYTTTGIGTTPIASDCYVNVAAIERLTGTATTFGRINGDGNTITNCYAYEGMEWII